MTRTVTYDPEQWQLVPKRATVEMLEEMMFATTYDNAWSQALASAPQHPDTGETTSSESNSPT